MTPSMGMAAPKGTQAPQAGLAALAQPAQTPKGMPSGSIQQIMALARKMSDAQLADVLSGKSIDVPQYVAMTEAMGRKSLRNAMQGAQAMAQAKQPSLKDKFLSEEAQAQMAQQMAQAPQAGAQGGGLSSLPAPNMDSMGMAGGGIVAFDGGGTAYDPNELSVPELSGADKKLWEKIKGKLSEWNEPWAPPKGTPAEIRGVMTGKIPAGALEKEAAAAASVPNQVSQAAVGNREEYRSAPAIPTKGVQFDPTAGGNPAVAALANKAASAGGTGVGTAAGVQPYSIPSFESLQKNKSQDYLAKLEGLTEKQRAGLDEIKKQGGGEALMQLAAGILGRPNLAQGLAAGMPMVASTAAATRKEARAVENAANEYDLNLAKAREAAEKGDMALALQYQQLANQASYQQGMLGIYGQRNAMMKDQYETSKLPGQLGKLYADATKEVKDLYGGMVPPSKQKQYTADIEKAYRKRAQAVGLGKYVDLYSPGAINTNFNLVQSLPKGAKIYDPSADDQS